MPAKADECQIQETNTHIFFPHRQSKFDGELHNEYVYTGVFGESDYCGNAVPRASRADQRLYAERKKDCAGLGKYRE
jgi:hypothetical protein